MKSLNEYEPITTDDLLRKNATSENTLSEDYSALAAHAVRLEQKLAACREAMVLAHKRLCYHAPLDANLDTIEQTLAATAP